MVKYAEYCSIFFNPGKGLMAERKMVPKFCFPKVLFITTVCGTHSAFLLPFVSYFRKIGWHIDGLANGIAKSKDCLEAYNNVYDFPFNRSPLKLWDSFSEMKSLISLFIEGNYDLIHVHTPIAAFFSRLAFFFARGACNSKVIYTAHGFHFFKGSGLSGLIFLLLEKVASFWTDVIIVINREDLKNAVRFTLGKKQLYMPGIGVDRAKYKRASECKQLALRKDLQLGDSKCIIMIAEFNPGKRHVDLLRAFREIQRKDIFLLLAGDGLLLDEMKKLSESLGIARQVKFLGLRSNIVELLSISILNILPSVREGLPRSLLEAMSIGIPCMGSDIRGIRDLLGNDCGGLFPPLNPSAMAKMIINVLNNDALRESWVENAKKKLIDFDLKKIIEMHEKLYQEILK